MMITQTILQGVSLQKNAILKTSSIDNLEVQPQRIAGSNKNPPSDQHDHSILPVTIDTR